MRKDLARDLGIGPSMVTKLAARGMHTHTFEAAQAWRCQNLRYIRSKHGLANFSMRAKSRLPPIEPAAVCIEVARAIRLGKCASVLLGTGQFDLIEADLRSALRAIPHANRGELAMDRLVWNALIADFAGFFIARERGEALIDVANADLTARLIYAIAARDDVEFAASILAIAGN